MNPKWYQVLDKITIQKYPERRMPQNVLFQTKEEAKSGKKKWVL